MPRKKVASAPPVGVERDTKSTTLPVLHAIIGDPDNLLPLVEIEPRKYGRSTTLGSMKATNALGLLRYVVPRRRRRPSDVVDGVPNKTRTCSAEEPGRTCSNDL